MGPTEVGLGTHIHIIVVRIVEHGVDSCHGGDANRARWKSFVAVGVVRTVGGKHFLIDTLGFEIARGKFHGRVGLEAHAIVEAVNVHTRHLRHFALIIGLLIDNARQGNHLVLRKSHVLGLLHAVLIPKALALFVHPLKKIAHADVPIQIIRVGNKHSDNGLRGVPVALADLRIVEGVE